VIHELRATPATCFWGFFDAALPPVLRVRSGDLVRIETLTHQAGDAPDLMMDAGVRVVYDAIPIAARGPGVHVMTGPIYVEGAAPGDTLEVRVLSMEPRLAYGTNIAAWWGHLYDDFGKERITIYRIDTASGLARAAFAFDYKTTPLRAARHRRAAGRRRPSARPERRRGTAAAALRRGRRGATRARPDQ
jgi:acetamidase/formamidase